MINLTENIYSLQHFSILWCDLTDEIFIEQRKTWKQEVREEKEGGGETQDESSGEGSPAPGQRGGERCHGRRQGHKHDEDLSQPCQEKGMSWKPGISTGLLIKNLRL